MTPSAPNDVQRDLPNDEAADAAYAGARDGGGPGAAGSQDEAIALLADPATHDGRAVTRIDTHGAMVFLAGERALKLKRDIRLPYMDFGSVERRREMCARELARNRPLAPGLYRGIRPILRRGGGALRLGRLQQDGRPRDGALDWVVESWRFPQDALLSVRARQGAMPAPLLRDLGARVARMHDEAAPIAGTSGAAALDAVLRENLAEMRDLAAVLPGAEVEALAAASAAELARRAALLDARAADGLVRRCHGDLHLANVVLLEGRPRPFDAIEFNDAFTDIDVLYDLAFLLMDLLHHGQAAAACAVQEGYLAARREEEDEGLALLPLLLSVRAAVRAKVDATTAGLCADEAQAAAHARDARRMLAEAIAFLAPGPPRLLAVGGLSGSGKTTLARALAPRLGPAPGAVLLRSDVQRKRLAGAALDAPLDERWYAPEIGERVYAELGRRAARLLAAGRSVILDAVFADGPAARAALAAAASAGPSRRGLWLRAPRAALEARTAARNAEVDNADAEDADADATGRDASDAGPEIVRRQWAAELGPPPGWTMLDAGAAPEAVSEEAVRRLGLETGGDEVGAP